MPACSLLVGRSCCEALCLTPWPAVKSHCPFHFTCVLPRQRHGPFPLETPPQRPQHIQPPGLLDGGDVLQLPGSRHILVGLSRRTNAAALQQMQELLLDTHSVHGVAVRHGLHLKSACTALDASTMLYADNEAGRDLRGLLQQHPAFSSSDSSGSSSSSRQSWQHVLVDPVCANVLLLDGEQENKHVVMSSGGRQSQQLVERLARERNLQLHKLQFDEFAKADGSLTCCSILLPSAP